MKKKNVEQKEIEENPDDFDISSILASGMDVEQRIVQELVNTENIKMKTELDKPIRWSCLTTFNKFIKSKGLSGSNKIIDSFMNESFILLVSNSRKGRTEYVQSLLELKKKEKDNEL